MRPREPRNLGRGGLQIGYATSIYVCYQPVRSAVPTIVVPRPRADGRPTVGRRHERRICGRGSTFTPGPPEPSPGMQHDPAPGRGRLAIASSSPPAPGRAPRSAELSGQPVDDVRHQVGDEQHDPDDSEEVSPVCFQPVPRRPAPIIDPVMDPVTAIHSVGLIAHVRHHERYCQETQSALVYLAVSGLEPADMQRP